MMQRSCKWGGRAARKAVGMQSRTLSDLALRVAEMGEGGAGEEEGLRARGTVTRGRDDEHGVRLVECRRDEREFWGHRGGGAGAPTKV